MAFTLSPRSDARLSLTHPDLAKVIRRSAELSTNKFTVLQTIRTLAEQKHLVSIGASKTMRSRHLPSNDGLSRAVDIAPIVLGKVSWAWPLYHDLAKIVKQAAQEEGVPIEWGGDWNTFKDGPHWQLPWEQ